MSSSVWARSSRRAVTLLRQHPERALIGCGVFLVFADSALTDPAPRIPSAPPAASSTAKPHPDALPQPLMKRVSREEEAERAERVRAEREERERIEREDPDERPVAKASPSTSAAANTPAATPPRGEAPAASQPAVALLPTAPERHERSTSLFASVPYEPSAALAAADRAAPGKDEAQRPAEARGTAAAEPSGLAARLLAVAPAPLAALAAELLGGNVPAEAEGELPVEEPEDLPTKAPRGTHFPPLTQPGGPAAADGRVATFTLDSTAEGSVYVSSFHEVRASNWVPEGAITCRLESMLSVDPHFGDCAAGETCGALGYAKSTFQGTLPRDAEAGAPALRAWQSVAAVLPLHKGLNTYYVVGRSDCLDAVWGAITLRAVRIE